MKGEGRVLAWKHCLTHISQGHCNYLADATGHRKNVIGTKIVPSCPQLPGKRFLNKSSSAVWRGELALCCLGLSEISYKYPLDLVCPGCNNCRLFCWNHLLLFTGWNVWIWKVYCLRVWGVTFERVSEITIQCLRPTPYDRGY